MARSTESTIRLALLPLLRDTHNSRLSGPILKKAIADPSGETAAEMAFSIRICGFPPRMETVHTDGMSFPTSSASSNRCALSGNQPVGNQLVGAVLECVGNCNGRVSPLAMCRM